MFFSNQYLCKRSFNWAIAFIFCLQSVILTGCKKLVEVSAPATAIAANSVYTSNATAAAVMTGLYQKINLYNTSFTGSIPSLTLFGGLSADEFSLWGGVTNFTALAYYDNALTANVANYGSEYWGIIYPYIFVCNDAIAGLNGSTSLAPAVKQQALGEAKFMRAFFYFYLVNLYGDVPLVINNDYKVSAFLSRTTKQQVYQQIVEDLNDAQGLLSSNYLDATLLNTTADRVRPTKWAALALLSRTYLYTGNWAGADSASSVLINNSAMFSISTIGNAFLRASLGNNEAILQWQPVYTAPTNVYDAYVFIVPSTGPGTGTFFGAYLSNTLLNSFEPNDQRRKIWVDSTISGGVTYFYPYKYKLTTGPVNEHEMVLRLAEQYLIRAEARAQENNISGAQADLNVVRARAGLPGTTASSQAGLLTAILHERQVELFAELAHRWLDLKRSGTIDVVMGTAIPKKGMTPGSAWSSYQQLYPISVSDIQLNPNLKQNSGY